MYSKAVMVKMIAEVKVPTLVALAKESLGSIGEKPDSIAKEAVANLESIIGELRRRITPSAEPEPVRAPRTRRNNSPTPPQGGEQNGG